MSQKCAKKLVLLKTFYYRARTQDDKDNANKTNFVTNPSTISHSSIRRMTDKNFNSIKNEFILFPSIRISANNPISGINKQITQDSLIIKTKCGFVSANTFFFDESSSHFATVLINNFAVTAASGDLKNAVQVTIEYDNDGTRWSNGVIYARRVSVYGCK